MKSLEMKRFIVGTVALFSCCLFALNLRAASPEIEKARQHGAQGQVTFRVVDSMGRPVEKAEQRATFPHSDSYGDVVVSKGLTDTNGVFIATGKTIDSVIYDIKKDGYYKTAGAYWFYRPSGLDANKSSSISSTSGEYWLYHQGENSVQDGRWQPWNPKITVVLKEHRNPIAMNAKNVDVVIPVQGTPIGFDLEQGDWVAPYGQGRRSDFVLLYAATYEGPQTFSKCLELTFSNAKDGLQVLPLDRSTEFMSVYDAPESGYDSTLTLERERTRTKIVKSHELGKDQYLVFRVRTVTDKEGKITSANYGKVYGPIEYGRIAEQHRLTFTYYLNPTDNDRNLEFDPKRNLFKNLSSLEEVRDP